MADVFVGPIMKKLIGIGFEYLKDQVRWQTGMKEELERLQKNYPQIQAVVDYASTLEHIKDNNPALNRWLWQLRDAIDEADDVMEELECMEHKEEQLIRTEKPRKVRSIMRSLKKRLVQIGLRSLKIDPTLKRLEEVVHKLDEVSVGFNTFLQLAKEAKQKHQEQQVEQNRARETGSFYANALIGRGHMKETVMKWLRNPSNDSPTTLYSNISLLSVVGQGGMGKTTLLQDIYKKEEMKNDFDLKLWVCVSNNFNVTKVITDMLESLKNQRPHLETIDALQKNLESEVKTKKFLLVLDDIWEEENKELNKSKWEKVLAPLASGKLGSKILVTTRMGSVSVMLSEIIHKKMENLILEGLNDDECLQLLHNHAFNKGEDPTAYQNLWPIAKKIVKKLSGSPLAAKVIGGVLNSRLDETHWNKVLNYEIGSQNDILDILKLSYISLPKVLQSCFLFCCTFPQDYEFDKDDLVRMWIALGFIQPDKTRRETMKDAGERYFDDLIQKSLFDKFQKWDQIYCYKLHDLLHEMLRIFSTQECLSIVGGEEELLSRNPKTIRHLFVKDINPIVLKKVKEFKHLRSFILIYSESHEDLDDILAKIFITLRSIRLIYINVEDLKKIPEEIGGLIHLKYLNINSDTQLPPASLPLWQLPFLKYLYLLNMPDFKGFDYRFHGNEKIRVFPSLQVLHIEGLKALENLFVATEASYECLFPCLTEMYLHDCPNLLELLPLSPKLEKLEIGRVFPSLQVLHIVGLDALEYLFVVKKASYECLFPCLSELHLYDCPNLLELLALPPKHEKLEIGHVFPSLQVLHIKRLFALKNLFVATEASYECLFPCLTELHLEDCPNLLELLALPPKLEKLEIGRVFPSLQVLHIKEMEALEDWFVTKAATYECLFPCLTELHLYDCPNLLELPAGLPPKLEKLEIYNIGWKGSNWLQGIRSNYCSISIRNCPNLLFLEGHQEMDQTTEKCQLILSLLVINDPSLLLKVSLTSVTSIQKLRIENNDEVVSFSKDDFDEWFLKVSSSLRVLMFISLKSLQFLPSSLGSLSSLKNLFVKDIPMLQLLPNMPASLKKLSLEKLPQLRELPDLPPSLKFLNICDFHPELMNRYQCVTGSYWHKIAHIPKVRIY